MSSTYDNENRDGANSVHNLTLESTTTKIHEHEFEPSGVKTTTDDRQNDGKFAAGNQAIEGRAGAP